ncbi:MAG TPA: TetR/AcrR family transcriptional regulator [Deltaproteobacteria bacterium]|nr:TetR/AcrR family transcriptional regulator [Deltaproteobacteria bacterium]
MPKKNGSDKRIQILEALNRCLQNKPFDKTSIKEIARAADVNHGLLHYYFKSKEDILIQYIDYVIDHYRSMVKERFNDKELENIDIKKLIEEFFMFTHDRITLDRSLSKVFIEIWEIAVYHPAVKAKLQRAYQEWMDVLSNMLKPLNNDIDLSRRTSFATVAFLEGMALFSIILDTDSKEFKTILSDFQSKIIDML